MTVSERPQVPQARQPEIDQLRAEVAALKQQLRQTQRLAAVGTMAAMVAHEFNNILTPVINYAQLARRNPALTDKALDRAGEGGKRATEICRALLGLAGRQADAPAPVDLVELTHQTLKAMARNPRKDQIELKIDLPESLSVTARTVELQQVILNLLLNARTAVLARPGLREIEISAHEQDGEVRFSVRDTGVGIHPADLPKIFQPFYSTNPDTEADGSGHGLGLAVCNEIIRSLGGDILVQSQPDAGSCFTVVLPA